MIPNTYKKHSLLPLRAISILSAVLLLSACSGGWDMWGSDAPVSANANYAQSQAASATNQGPSVAAGPVVNFVQTAASGAQRLLADPAFGGNVRVTKGADYFAASGRRCIRFAIKQMSVMNDTTRKIDEQNILCAVNGTMVLRHPAQSQ